MQRFTLMLVLLAGLFLVTSVPVQAGLFGDDTLVSINGNDYTTEDFKDWWARWKDEDTTLPETPDPYIDWLLLSEEARRMDLLNDPSFERQMRVFVKSRALLMLKYDEVDSQIEITDEDVEQHYDQQFAPRWRIQSLDFGTEEKALAAWEKLQQGELTVADLLVLTPQEGGPIEEKQQWVRPGNIDPGWTAIYRDMSADEVVEPEKHKNGPYLYYLKELKPGDEKDLAKLRERIRADLWKKQEDIRTQALIFKLRDEYDVKVNEERLAALDLNAPKDSFSDEPVITTSRRDFSEKEFIAVVERLKRTRPMAAHAGKDPEEARKFKKETAFNIIAQSVTDWAAVDRHYEEKEPFKSSYEFSVNHRLGGALAQRMFAPKAEVSKEEIEQYYQENIEHYSRPATVKLFMIDETQGPIERIWADVSTGGNFLEVVKEYDDIKIIPQDVPVNHLDPEVKPVVDKLVKGEISPIFTAQGVRLIVYLADRSPIRPLPLDKVSDTIRSELRKEKFSELRSEFLVQLRSASDIEIDEREWKKLRKELGDAS